MNNSVYQLQTWLQTISRHNNRIPFVIPDGIYGPETTVAVKAFQMCFGLDSTGDVDFTTWNAINNEYLDTVEKYELFETFAPFKNFIFTSGEKGTPVFILQILLIDLANKYSNITRPDLNGVYDDKTEKAVNEIKLLSEGPNVYNNIIRIYKNIH